MPIVRKGLVTDKALQSFYNIKEILEWTEGYKEDLDIIEEAIIASIRMKNGLESLVSTENKDAVQFFEIICRAYPNCSKIVYSKDGFITFYTNAER